MTAKTKKELQAENISLKEELANVKEKFAELSEKFKELEQHKQIPLFQCKKCNKSFLSSEDLKIHMKNHADRNQIFKCIVKYYIFQIIVICYDVFNAKIKTKQAIAWVISCWCSFMITSK